MTATERLPVLPLRELVLFPGATATLRVGRQASLEALTAGCVSETDRLALVSLVVRRVDDPVAADVLRSVYRLGSPALWTLTRPRGHVRSSWWSSGGCVWLSLIATQPDTLRWWSDWSRGRFP